jgi:hypothetical protein
MRLSWNFRRWQHRFIVTVSATNEMLWNNKSSSVKSQALTYLFRPRLTVSSKVFQNVFVHLVYNSALHLVSCWSFLLRVVATVICIFLVSRQLVLISTLQKFIHSRCGQTGCTRQFFWKISSQLKSILFYTFVMPECIAKRQILHRPIVYLEITYRKNKRVQFGNPFSISWLCDSLWQS